ncbi:MAG: CRTAC1 family protein [Planctomycetes bacterium]|nr:CRTAC1 family protein [Planctomycetota bacterium]
MSGAANRAARAGAILAVAVPATWSVVTSATASAALADAQSAVAVPADEPVFIERRDCGVDFVHRRFMTEGKKYLCETAGAGVALFDYDGDGLLDLYCVQSCPLPGWTGAAAAPPDQLFRNLGGFRFEAVTATVAREVTAADGTRTTLVRPRGLGDQRYGMGVTCPDIDNDGDPDLYVTNVGRDVLYRNEGDGTFTDVTESAGLVDESWSAAAGWADLDGDGDLDLYLANYAQIDFAKYKPCTTKNIVNYCHPDTLKSAPDRLFRNDGGFKFTEITKEAGIVEPDEGGKGLAVIPFDQDDDGRLDLYIANDADPNYLWMNRGGMKFEEEAGVWCVDVSGRGASQSCMGSDLADIDGDLDFDLFSANFGKEASILYVRGKDGYYDDRTYPSGLGGPSYLFTGFGARFFDYDRDADQDLMVVNGHIVDNAELFDPTQTFKQVPHLYANRGDGRFDQIGPRLSPFFSTQNVGRGLATGDLDNDGDLDVVVLENDAPLAVLENVGKFPGRWIGFALVGTKSPRDAIGAIVTIECAGKSQAIPLVGSSSYLSWGDLRLYFGLGTVAPDATVNASIRWPSGTRQSLPALPSNRYHRIEEPR